MFLQADLPSCASSRASPYRPFPLLLPLPKDHGIHGFFSGVTLRIARKGASSAIAWSVYEGLLLVFRDREIARKKDDI
jgi:hypothetical protein